MATKPAIKPPATEVPEETKDPNLIGAVEGEEEADFGLGAPPVPAPPPARPEIPDAEAAADFATLRSRLRVSAEATPAEVVKAALAGLWSRRVVMLIPNNQPVNMRVAFGFMAQIKKQPWLGVEYECDTVIQRARNILADRFLKTEADWSFWHDSDMVSPFGHPGFFYATLGLDPKRVKPEFLAVNVLDRLLSSKKSIVGAVYQQRNPPQMGARMVIQPHLHPRNDADKNLVEKLRRGGPFNELYPVSYVATGCCVVHRKVYEDIKAAHPERQPAKAGEPYDFFGHDVGTGGEDIAFCKLAAEAGHPSFLDCGALAAHLGTNAFFPEWL